jgi:hypothetical protein
MEDGEPFCFLAPSMSRQQNQRRQDHWQGTIAHQQSSHRYLKDGGEQLAAYNTYLGAQFRRLRTKLGAPVAIKAMAAKLARLVYRMLRFGMEFIDRGAQFYEAQMHGLQVRHLKWKAAKLGFQLTEITAA